ncbi:F-box/kelch-repeat protein at3g06240 [Phtheirospermum japonicum]|uniref:F-box/kelch-repeat protein at3g06240 n=1 Tax=Phtheirospermum japonicum TaxID=374723 RepID=A0A830B612_9LAMI|nr:F-box/kelch-repeat protein at3g06240 [Phtheirospermum japonicum]
MNVKLDKKLLLRRRADGNATNEDRNVHYFSMLSTDNNGRHFSLEKNYYLQNHKLEKLSYRSEIVGSCNGILCLKDGSGHGNAVLWNPLTDELKSLPPSSIERPAEARVRTFSACGFGFDARSEDYKVARFVKNWFYYNNGCYKTTTHHFELYSLKTDSWRPITAPQTDPWSSSSTSVNGSCYWYDRDCVLSFDFADEMFSRLPLPVPNPGGNTFHLFIDYDGSLGSIVYPWVAGRKRFDLWVWKNGSWSKVDSFALEDVRLPLGLWGRDQCFLEGTNYQLLLFDLTTRVLKPLDIEDYEDTMRLVPFVESTVSINGHSKVDQFFFVFF